LTCRILAMVLRMSVLQPMRCSRPFGARNLNSLPQCTGCGVGCRVSRLFPHSARGGILECIRILGGKGEREGRAAAASLERRAASGSESSQVGRCKARAARHGKVAALLRRRLYVPPRLVPPGACGSGWCWVECRIVFRSRIIFFSPTKIWSRKGGWVALETAEIVR
jgi:hypothetical protein